MEVKTIETALSSPAAEKKTKINGHLPSEQFHWNASSRMKENDNSRRFISPFTFTIKLITECQVYHILPFSQLRNFCHMCYTQFIHISQLFLTLYTIPCPRLEKRYSKINYSCLWTECDLTNTRFSALKIKKEIVVKGGEVCRIQQ